MGRNPLPLEAPGLQPSPRGPQECSSLPASFTVRGPPGLPDRGLAEGGALRGSQWRCPTSSPGTVILSAEALAMRRAKQAQRRAQQAPAQLSKEQQELVQTLLGAHTRHVGTMFDQFVQFRVSLYRGFGLKGEQRGARGGDLREGAVCHASLQRTRLLQNPRVDRLLSPEPSNRGLERPLGPGPLTQALISAASSSSVHPPPAPAHHGPRTASARALRRGQHFHGTASHQVHQGPAPLPVRDLPLPFRRKTLQ